MLEPLSLFVGSIHVGEVILILLEQGIPEQVSRRFPKKITKRIEVLEDKISALPDDLLVQILLLVPTKDAVATMILSKRWRYIWTMVPKLDYLNDHELGPRCPVDVNVDVGKWIEKAVNRKVLEIEFIRRWSAEHTSLPKRLYTCDTLVFLSLSEKILVDVPSLACLPSLEDLELHSLRSHNGGTLVIDCPTLKEISIADYSWDSCFFENKPHLDKAFISGFCNPDDKFVACLSSVINLELVLNFATFAWFNTISFSQLLECKITLVDNLDWLEPQMFLLQNSPNLKLLSIDKKFVRFPEELPLSWNQPSSVPKCLSTHLEIFEWNEYGGKKQRERIGKIHLCQL
ncbi:unnamed protein product [Brassica rapa]|uniref:F-box domain-containing protein n=1 Tax=Brassica campestris TaxID=3711 RepID=A0A8D9G2B7_BRACM|nr:unnamed protein product [Brassica rapa]